MSGYDLFVGKVSLIYPHANYEWRNENGVTRQFHYLENGILVLKENNNDFWYFRILTDNVGSVVRVIDSEGTAVVEVSYDAWGKPTVALNQMAFPRGFGGHEMLTKYRLVNMDGRLYDYELGRFLSPDDYVQEPSNSQNFNRYTYCLNNPLKYTDPTGEFFGLDDLIMAAVNFVVSYVSSGIQTHNWGWASVQNGLVSAGMSIVTGGIGGFGGAISATTWKRAGMIVANGVLGNVLPDMGMNISLGSHFSFYLSPTLAFSTDGFNYGAYGSLNYDMGHLHLSLGGGTSKDYKWGFNAAVKGKNFGLGYAMTSYNEQQLANGVTLGEQRVGTYTLMFGNNNYLSVSEDHSAFGGDGEDRYRTFSAEIGVGDYSFGTYISSNDGMKESGYSKQEWKVNRKGIEDDFGKIGKMAWPGGKIHSSPLWFGYRRGNMIQRIGINSPVVQQVVQNTFHYLINYPQYNQYTNNATIPYYHIGTRNPLNLW